MSRRKKPGRAAKARDRWHTDPIDPAMFAARPPHVHGPGDTVSTCTSPGCQASARRVGEEREKNLAAIEKEMSLLLTMLDVAVPMAVMRFQEQRLSHQQVINLAGHLGEVLGENGDVLQFGGKGCAEAFAAIAKGLAACSFSPGGVRFVNRSWQSDPAWLAKKDNHNVSINQSSLLSKSMGLEEAKRNDGLSP